MSPSFRVRALPAITPRRAWQLFLATATVALAAGLSQAALAAPHDGPALGMAMEAGGAPHGARGRHLEHMLRTANATAEQRAQIRQIVQASRAQAQPLRANARKLHQEGQALLAQTTVDARALEALRQQMLALHDEGSKIRMQVMLDISRVLTPEQRKSLAERRAQRRAMMERHRAEREGMERAPR